MIGVEGNSLDGTYARLFRVKEYKEHPREMTLIQVLTLQTIRFYLESHAMSLKDADRTNEN
jgi:hypothetical protein